MNVLKATLKSSLLVLPLFFATAGNAQKIDQKSSVIKVSGTSSLHDWEMSGSNATFSGVVSGNAITNVSFSVPVKNLKSAKGKMMDNKAYDALNASKAPNISFQASSISIGKSTVSGKMTIAGVSKNVSFPVTVTKKGAAYVIEGTETIKMSDFGMSRPGFMGVKTGDVVTVKVSIQAQ